MRTTEIGSDYPSHLPLSEQSEMCFCFPSTGDKFMKLVCLAATLASMALSGSTAHSQELAAPTKACEAGVFVVGGETYSFEDVAVEGLDAVELNSKGQLVVYGYITDLIPTGDVGIMRAKIGTVKECLSASGWIQPNRNTEIDIILAQENFTEAGWKDAKRAVLQSVDGLFAKALIRLTAKFEVYTNAMNLYLLGTAIEVVDVLPANS